MEMKGCGFFPFLFLIFHFFFFFLAKSGWTTCLIWMDVGNCDRCLDPIFYSKYTGSL